MGTRTPKSPTDTPADAPTDTAPDAPPDDERVSDGVALRNASRQTMNLLFQLRDLGTNIGFLYGEYWELLGRTGGGGLGVRLRRMRKLRDMVASLVTTCGGDVAASNACDPTDPACDPGDPGDAPPP